MNRAELACQYHKEGYNCAQAVAGAFADRTGLELRQVLAVSGGFGGGVGGTHEELCGAVSGGVMVLSLLYPHLDNSDPDSKPALYARAADFRSRFLARFGNTCCGRLLETVPTEEEAAKMGLTKPCDVLIAGAVEIVEEMLAELG